LEAVILSATIASTIELFGNDNAPVTFKFVVVTLLATMLVGEKLVVPRLVKKPLVLVILSPLAVVKLTLAKNEILLAKVVVAPLVELTVRAPSAPTERFV